MTMTFNRLCWRLGAIEMGFRGAISGCQSIGTNLFKRVPWQGQLLDHSILAVIHSLKMDGSQDASSPHAWF